MFPRMVSGASLSCGWFLILARMWSVGRTLKNASSHFVHHAPCHIITLLQHQRTPHPSTCWSFVALIEEGCYMVLSDGNILFFFFSVVCFSTNMLPVSYLDVTHVLCELELSIERVKVTTTPDGKVLDLFFITDNL